MGAKKTNPDDSSEEVKGKMKVVSDEDAKTEKKSLFGAAKTKAPAKSAKTDKEAVVVPEMEQKLKDLQEFRAQIADLEALVSGITDELKSVAWDKFIELYKRDKANPNTFLIKDGSGCIMVLPTDKYISVKDEERADKLNKEYGDIVSKDERFYFNSAVLERNMETIEKLLMESKDISDEDKENLLQKEVKFYIKKGTIDNLLKYGDKMATALSDIQPVMQLKNCGGAMAEGGNLEDGEVIYDSRDDYFRDDLFLAGRSNCCDAPVYGESDICSKCGEHCEVSKLYAGGFLYEVNKVGESAELRDSLMDAKNIDQLKERIIAKYGSVKGVTARRMSKATGAFYQVKLAEGGSVSHDHRLNSFEALAKKYK